MCGGGVGGAKVCMRRATGQCPVPMKECNTKWLYSQDPLKGFLETLGKLQQKIYAKNQHLSCPIRTYLVTVRSAASTGAQVLKTLRCWSLEVDEALFLAGAPKGPLLQKIRPHIFFDDQMFHIREAQEEGTIAAHVPYGIEQKYYKGGTSKSTICLKGAKY